MPCGKKIKTEKLVDIPGKVENIRAYLELLSPNQPCWSRDTVHPEQRNRTMNISGFDKIAPYL
ncbi:MAG: hypothetical protein D3908_05820, partial [Candidatus Electrothrix sp. AUS4]|nr:hypothetical protein [Candidatus Electrothrix sp. AUS4]